jgi:hypothetical protein
MLFLSSLEIMWLVVHDKFRHTGFAESRSRQYQTMKKSE